jgi:hypothetical protein
MFKMMAHVSKFASVGVCWRAHSYFPLNFIYFILIYFCVTSVCSSRALFKLSEDPRIRRNGGDALGLCYAACAWDERCLKKSSKRGAIEKKTNAVQRLSTLFIGINSWSVLVVAKSSLDYSLSGGGGLVW